MSGEHSPERPVDLTGEDDKDKNKKDDGKPENEKTRWVKWLKRQEKKQEW